MMLINLTNSKPFSDFLKLMIELFYVVQNNLNFVVFCILNNAYFFK